MITGRDDPGVGDRLRKAGAAAYLNKPLEEARVVGGGCSGHRCRHSDGGTGAIKPRNEALNGG